MQNKNLKYSYGSAFLKRNDSFRQETVVSFCPKYLTCFKEVTKTKALAVQKLQVLMF